VIDKIRNYDHAADAGQSGDVDPPVTGPEDTSFGLSKMATLEKAAEAYICRRSEVQVLGDAAA
jgi:hypothetical protein